MTDDYLTPEERRIYDRNTMVLPAKKPEAPAPVEREKTPRAGGMAGIKGVNSNSHAAYNSIKKELGAKQLEVLRVIQEAKRPLCDQEIGKALGWTINRVTNRRGELHDMGLIRKAGRGIYPPTGRPVDCWTAVTEDRS